MKILYLIFLIFSLGAVINSSDLNCTITEFSQVSDVVKTCKNITVSNLHVPGGIILDFDLQPGSTVAFEGTTLFEFATWVGPLIRFKGDGVFVQGSPGSVFDGQGALYWDGRGGGGGITKPYFFQIETTGGSVFKNITLLNCPHHCVIISSSDLTLTGWNVDVSAGDKDHLGHNTDGFDVIYGKNIIIENSIVQNQDDCVAINRGTDMFISNLDCSGGHGISLSVGFSHASYSHNTVHNVTFTDCIVRRSANGIHVKTHNDAYFGEIKNVTYRNIQLEDIWNYGMSIQQDYANGTGTGHPTSNIPVTNLTMTNVTGTLTGQAMAVYIICGSTGCIDWTWSDVLITGAMNHSSCNYIPKGYVCD